MNLDDDQHAIEQTAPADVLPATQVAADKKMKHRRKATASPQDAAAVTVCNPPTSQQLTRRALARAMALDAIFPGAFQLVTKGDRHG